MGESPRIAMVSIADEIVAVSGGSPRRAYQWSARHPHMRYKDKNTGAVLLVFDEDGSSTYITETAVHHVDSRGVSTNEAGERLVVERSGKPTFSAAALPIR